MCASFGIGGNDAPCVARLRCESWTVIDDAVDSRSVTLPDGFPIVVDEFDMASGDIVRRSPVVFPSESWGLDVDAYGRVAVLATQVYGL